MKRLGILTSGGDAPGMNACIRAIVRCAIYDGFEVFGIKRGFYGLVNDDVEQMYPRSVSDIIQRGGTILRTARCNEFRTEEGMQRAYQTILKYQMDALICIGGDGTFRGANDLTQKFDIPTIGIPGTIDNDLAYTDYTLGFDTAVNTVVNLINNLRDTMTSHERVSLVQVMGNRCGDIALYSGVASGAEIIIIPEVKTEVADVIKTLQYSIDFGKKSNIIIISEGVSNYDEIIKGLEDSKFYMRETILGHLQRGGSPTMQDRILASSFGNHAVELLRQDKGMRVVGIKDNKICDFGLKEIQGMKRPLNEKMINLAKILAK